MIKKRNVNNKYYLVEKVLMKRILNGKVEYLIKWKNYSSKSNSWEPQQNVKIIKPGRIPNVPMLKEKNAETAVKTDAVVPVKILFRLSNGYYLVKWSNGKNTLVQLNAGQAYQIIVNNPI